MHISDWSSDVRSSDLPKITDQDITETTTSRKSTICASALACRIRWVNERLAFMESVGPGETDTKSNLSTLTFPVSGFTPSSRFALNIFRLLSGLDRQSVV